MSSSKVMQVIVMWFLRRIFQVRMMIETLQHGPKVVWDAGVRKCIIEMDSLIVLNWVKGVKEVICSIGL